MSQKVWNKKCLLKALNLTLLSVPQRPALDAVRSSLKLLAASASRLQVECRKAAPSDSSASTVDYQLLTQQVIQCAYDIAKAAKQLVTITTREKKQWPTQRIGVHRAGDKD